MGERVAMSMRLVAEKLAKATTRRISLHCGRRVPFVHVCEHPKSGGTWLAKMVADYLQLPFPRHSVLPLGFACVVQSHWRYDVRLRPAFYLYRDGRDVMVSLYFDRMRVGRGHRPGARYVARTYERLLGRGYDPNDVTRNLPRFIEFEFARPGRGTSLNWRDHLLNWYAPDTRDWIAYVSYEDLRRDCNETLRRAIETATGEIADPWRLSVTVEKMSMLRQSGRRPGQEDRAHAIRKGIVGDWRNHFSREAADLFDHLAGDMLVRLGYERDRGWVDRYDYVAG